MRYDVKRSRTMTPEQVQEGNRSWWSSNPMTYDWHGEIQIEPLSRGLVREVVPESYLRQAQARYGTFLFLVAANPS